MTESPKTVFVGVSALLVMVALVVGVVLMLQRVSVTKTQLLAEEARQRARSIASEARDRTREIDAEARAELDGNAANSAAAAALAEAVQALLASAEAHLAQGRTEAGLALLDAAAAQVDMPAMAGSAETVITLRHRLGLAYQQAGRLEAALAQIEAALLVAKSATGDEPGSALTLELEALAKRLRPPPDARTPGN